MATLTHISHRRLAIDELDKSIVNLSARINASTSWLVSASQGSPRLSEWVAGSLLGPILSKYFREAWFKVLLATVLSLISLRYLTG
jgi:hypothetical protein